MKKVRIKQIWNIIKNSKLQKIIITPKGMTTYGSGGIKIFNPIETIDLSLKVTYKLPKIK